MHVGKGDEQNERGSAKDCLCPRKTQGHLAADKRTHKAPDHAGNGANAWNDAENERSLRVAQDLQYDGKVRLCAC